MKSVKGNQPRKLGSVIRNETNHLTVLQYEHNAVIVNHNLIEVINGDAATIGIRFFFFFLPALGLVYQKSIRV